MLQGTRTTSREAQRFFLGEEQPTGAQVLLRDDAVIRDDLARTLALDPWVDAQAITIYVRDGEVTLEGEVEEMHARRAAGEDAWDTPGVKDVVNDLRLRRPEGPSRRERVALIP
jgi:osmotically-inducible protein OsmY